MLSRLVITFLPRSKCHLISDRQILLSWCKSNCNFALLNFARYSNIFLNKYGYITYHFNPHFSFYILLLMILLAVINNAFDPGTANKRTVQWWFKKFFKGNESLGDEEGEQWPAIGSCQWPIERIIEANPLRTAGEVAEELKIEHPMLIRYLKQIEKLKKLDKWVPHELTKYLKKKLLFWSVIFSYSKQQKWTIFWLDYDAWPKVDFI